MKTIKIKDETHLNLMYIKVTLEIDHKLKLKTLDEVIKFLKDCFINLDNEELEKLTEAYKNDKQRQK